MAKGNVPFLAFNRGLVSPKALARVDLDRLNMSAAVMTNWLPKTQGAMTIRPGTKHVGSSLNDSGAYYIEFVAGTDDVALPELTHEKMRIWLGSDAHALSLLGRPAVDTTLTLLDTGWSNTSTGGVLATVSTDVIPLMTGQTTNGVTITASSQNTSFQNGGDAWQVADERYNTVWQDTGVGNSALPSWLNVSFDTGDQSDTGNDTGLRNAITSYSLRADDNANALDNMPKDWRLITNNVDTGINATDTGQWTLEDEQTGSADWAVSEKRTFTLPGADTGTVEARRHWRLYVTAVDTGVGDSSKSTEIAELEMFTEAAAQQVKLQSATRVFNATSIGGRAKLQKRVIVSDTGTEHSLAIHVSRGPITLRCGSTSGDADYISETSLGTGYHNLAFTPTGNFHVTLQTTSLTNKIVQSLTIGDSGTVELTAPWAATNLDNVRYDQSADVVFVDAASVRPSKIERRGTGRSWSVVDYAPNNGPFLPSPSSDAKFSVSHFYGNTTLNSDVAFFTADHVGALVRIFHNGQGGQFALGTLDAVTDAIEVTGIGDTGVETSANERRIVFAVSGTYDGQITIERSFDSPDFGFKTITGNISTAAEDTGTFTSTNDDTEDNIKVHYRARRSDTGIGSGAAIIDVTYKGGGTTGIGRITGFNTNTDVDLEVLSRFSDTGTSNNWQQGFWSTERGFPTAVALHGGRLSHAQGGSIFLSVSDDFENFNDETEGDAGPIIRTLGSGPVDNIHYLISLLRLIIGTTGAEIALRSSSLDEPVTPDNSNARTFSTQGSKGLRAVKLDTSAIFVQRSGSRVFQIGFGLRGDVLGDYQGLDLTLLVPDLLTQGVVSIAIQRQPDTRIHCVLADGKVAILTHEPTEEVLAWSLWETDGTVERAMVLPGEKEDAVYYHINRTIGGATKRFLEKWALESETQGDTGLSFLADCAVSQTDTGRNATLQGFDHLIGEPLVAWGSDTGQAINGKDLSPDVAGVQITYVVDTGGNVNLSEAVHNAVAGLPYTADWQSTKLAYAAEAGTALAQVKRVGQIAFVLHNAHNDGLFFGSDTGNLDPLPRVSDKGAAVDADKIFATFDQATMPFSGTHNPDSRVHLRAKAPRPMTVLAAIPGIKTNEKV